MGKYRLFRNLLGQILTPERITTGYFTDVGECLFTPFNTIKNIIFFQRKNAFLCVHFLIYFISVLSLHFTEIISILPPGSWSALFWVTWPGNMSRPYCVWSDPLSVSSQRLKIHILCLIRLFKRRYVVQFFMLFVFMISFRVSPAQFEPVPHFH